VAPRSTAPTTSAAPTAAAPGATAAPAAAGPAADPDEAWARAFNPGQDEAAAWRALAALWGANLGPGDACSAAATAQLRCVRGRSSLAQLRQFDRPAWLRLVDAQGRVSPVLLLQLGPDTATLQLPGGAQTLPLAQLARFWRGDYGTLWRSPPAYREGDNPLANPELRAWVQQRLPLAPAPGAGDDALRAAVAAFQLQQGLTPDGVPGPLTLMQLARADGGAGAEPRLVLAR
jgi:general secretion pathway protein A